MPNFEARISKARVKKFILAYIFCANDSMPKISYLRF